MTSRVCLGSALVLLLLAFVFHLGLPAYSFYVLVALLVVSQLLGRRSLTGVVHERVINRGQVEEGETVAVSTEVRNVSSVPVLWLLAEDALAPGLPVEGQRLRVAFLPGGASRLLKYRVTFPRRGYYALGPLLLESGDLFGLVRKFKAGGQVDFVTVFPRVVPLGGYDIPTKKPVGEVRVRTRIQEDPTRLAGVREYLRGDPLNRIHWRATARTGRLHSKVYDPTTMLGANLVIDFRQQSYAGEGGGERAELVLVAAASLAAYILEHNQQVGILSNGIDAVDRLTPAPDEEEVHSRREAQKRADLRVESDRLRPVEVPLRRGDFHLGQIRHVLARLELSAGLSLGEMLLQEYPRLPREAALIVLAPRVPVTLARAFAELKHSGFAVAVFVVGDSAAWEQAVLTLGMNDIPGYHLENESQLAGIAELRF